MKLSTKGLTSHATPRPPNVPSTETAKVSTSVRGIHAIMNRTSKTALSLDLNVIVPFTENPSRAESVLATTFASANGVPNVVKATKKNHSTMS